MRSRSRDKIQEKPTKKREKVDEDSLIDEDSFSEDDFSSDFESIEEEETHPISRNQAKIN